MLGQIVFSDPQKRKQLNSITHWRIFRDILFKVIKLKISEGKKRVILDAPLLFETKILEHFCYPIITVYVQDYEMQLERFMNRNNFEERKRKEG